MAALRARGDGDPLDKKETGAGGPRCHRGASLPAPDGLPLADITEEKKLPVGRLALLQWNIISNCQCNNESLDFPVLETCGLWSDRAGWRAGLGNLALVLTEKKQERHSVLTP